MATHSTISILENSGTVKQIYCHSDGYLDYNGRLLKTYYKTPELVKELISHGDLSALGEYINPVGEHSFLKRESGCCVYYGRDRGESNTEFGVYIDWPIFKYQRQVEEYNYLFVEAENKWYLLGDKAEKIQFLTELDTVEEITEDFNQQINLKQIYLDVLAGNMSFNEFEKKFKAELKRA